MKFLKRQSVLAAMLSLSFVAFAFAHHHDASDEVDFSLAFLDDGFDESIDDAQFREEFAQDFSSLFEDEIDYAFADGIDIEFAWNNYRINAGMSERFDYKKLAPEDTIRIALIDSALGRFYAHPHPGHVTSSFGPRRYLWHYGMDTKLAVGDSVLNAFDGIVRVVQFDRRGYGNVVVVRHHNGLETLYGHLHRVTVEPNQRIKAGEMVGEGGNTGRSTGAHLHFEIRYYGEPFDPRHIIDYKNHRLKRDTLVLTRDNFEYLTVQRQRVVHTVRRGENLGVIARRYGTTVNNLCRMNGISSRSTLRVGQRLIVRQGTPPAPPQPKQQVAKVTASPETVVEPVEPIEPVETFEADEIDETIETLESIEEHAKAIAPAEAIEEQPIATP